jgi:hypothetical protein
MKHWYNLYLLFKKYYFFFKWINWIKESQSRSSFLLLIEMSLDRWLILRFFNVLIYFFKFIPLSNFFSYKRFSSRKTFLFDNLFLHFIINGMLFYFLTLPFLFSTYIWILLCFTVFIRLRFLTTFTLFGSTFTILITLAVMRRTSTIFISAASRFFFFHFRVFFVK